jgi:hypothetical protein
MRETLHLSGRWITCPNRKEDLLAKLESMSKTKAKSSHLSGESGIHEDL